ncbi:MAG: hypothetical protein RPU34_05885 [Candidatus Sedimenticola sp. (ex Thyasira tokunagai)]
MSSPELLRAFLSQASSSGSRSTALQPLGWLSGILTSGLVLAATWGTPEWALVTLAIFLGITVTIYLISYIVYAFKNPDALRSEKYTLSKMAIEKNLIGDDVSGLIEISESDNTPISQALPHKQESDK